MAEAAPATVDARIVDSIDVSSNKIGVGYGAWTRVDGWSESVVEYIFALEQMPLA